MPAVLVAFGYDWFHTGGGRRHRACVVLAIGLAFALWSLGLLALGLRTTFELPWRGVVGALALAAVIVAAFAVLPSALSCEASASPRVSRGPGNPVAVLEAIARPNSASKAGSSSAGIP